MKTQKIIGSIGFASPNDAEKTKKLMEIRAFVELYPNVRRTASEKGAPIEWIENGDSFRLLSSYSLENTDGADYIDSLSFDWATLRTHAEKLFTEHQNYYGLNTKEE